MTTETPAPEPLPAPPPTETSSRSLWIAAGVVALILIFFGRPLLRSIVPAPRLAPALKLLKEGKFAEAEIRLAELAAYNPTDPEVRIFLASAMLDQESPKSTEALAVLKPLRPRSAKQAAEAMFLQGRAYENLNQPSQAEASWLEALRIDPLVGEVGWLLLQLYYNEGREGEARALAMKLSENEPHPGDRVRLLMEPIRYEAEPLAAADVISRFAAAVKADPDDRPSSLAYYRAMAKDGTGVEIALAALQRLSAKFPEDLACWSAYLFALDTTGDLDGMTKALVEIPRNLADDPRIVGYRGRLAMSRKDYAAAIPDLEFAVAALPSDAKLLHLLGDAYRLAGQADNAEAVKAREQVLESARIELRGIKGKELEEGKPGLFDEAMSRRDFGMIPNPILYKRIADNRERMGHPDEALAWHKIVLRDDSKDVESQDAANRLGGETPP